MQNRLTTTSKELATASSSVGEQSAKAQIREKGSVCESRRACSAGRRVRAEGHGTTSGGCGKRSAGRRMGSAGSGMPAADRRMCGASRRTRSASGGIRSAGPGMCSATHETRSIRDGMGSNDGGTRPRCRGMASHRRRMAALLFKPCADFTGPMPASAEH